MYLKRKIILIAAVLISLCAMGYFYMLESEQKLFDYCYTVNSMICEQEFSMAYLEEGRIDLYKESGELIQSFPFPEFDQTFRIKHIRKDSDNIYFVVGASIDDEEGILFVNGDANRMLSGIVSIERVGGNSYKYSTR